MFLDSPDEPTDTDPRRMQNATGILLKDREYLTRLAASGGVHKSLITLCMSCQRESFEAYSVNSQDGDMLSVSTYLLPFRPQLDH